MKITAKYITIALAATGLAIVTALATPTPSDAGAACVDQTFRVSSSSKTCVKYIQILSNEVYKNSRSVLGSRAALATDGIYGSKTESAIRNLQGHARVTLKKSNGSEGKEIKLTKDGITGKQTWAILCTFNQLYKNDKHYDVLKKSGCLDAKGNHWAFKHFYSTELR